MIVPAEYELGGFGKKTNAMHRRRSGKLHGQDQPWSIEFCRCHLCHNPCSARQSMTTLVTTVARRLFVINAVEASYSVVVSALALTNLVNQR